MGELVKGIPAEDIEPVLKWGAWNEPDLPGSPLSNNAAEAADLWKVMHAIKEKLACACEIAAGEFSRVSQSQAYIESYKEAILTDPAYDKATPGVWGLHDYNDLVYFTEHQEHGEGNPELERFLQDFSSGIIWLSEQGVELDKASYEPTRLLVGHTSHLTGKWITPRKLQIEAADDFLHLAEHHRRVELVDYYLFRGPTANETKERKGFDSGLEAGEESIEEGEKQKPREAYCVLVEDKLHGCPRPKSKTGRAASVTNSSATLTGLVNPEELPTTYNFEYGKTANYGNDTTVIELPNPAGEQEAAAQISGLEECATYHYRITAENEASEGNEPGEVTPSRGEDETFETPCATRKEPPLAPPTFTLEAAEGGGTNVYVNPHGSSTTLEQQFSINPPEEPPFPKSPVGASTFPVFVTWVAAKRCDIVRKPQPPRTIYDALEFTATSAGGTETVSVPTTIRVCVPD